MHDFDLGIGTVLRFSANEHQGSHKVWGTQLDEAGHYNHRSGVGSASLSPTVRVLALRVLFATSALRGGGNRPVENVRFVATAIAHGPFG